MFSGHYSARMQPSGEKSTHIGVPKRV